MFFNDRNDERASRAIPIINKIRREVQEMKGKVTIQDLNPPQKKDITSINTKDDNS